MKKDWKTLRIIFTSTFTLSAFTVGGGYVIVPLMKKRFVDELQWIGEEEMLEMVAIAQSAPGVIAVNASILVGYHIAGVPGSMVAILGTALPPLILLSVISVFYDMLKGQPAVAALLRGMQAGVAAVICDVVLTMGFGVVGKKQALPIAMMAAAFIAAAVFHINVALIILVCGVIGGVFAAVRRRKEKKEGGN